MPGSAHAESDPFGDAVRLPAPEREAAGAEPVFDPDTVLVRFHRGVSATEKNRAAVRSDARVAEAVPGTDFVKVAAEASAEALVEALADDPAVAEVTLDYYRRPAISPNDPGYQHGDQRYLQTVRLPQAWDRIRSATKQVIAIVDTGVDIRHPDLKDRVVAGYNAVTGSANTTDTIGHGTMVAGVAAARTNNGEGVAGAAWNGRIMPVKVFGSDGLALDSDIAKGVRWAADRGAKIINMSLGGPGDSPVLHDAMKYAKGKGALLIAAAGNSSGAGAQYPAAYPEVTAVGATDWSGRLTDFSSYGDWVDLAAPGWSILSTYPRALGGYAIADGTSFSAPMVAGVAALVRAKNPSWTPAKVADRLRNTARDAGPRGIDPYYGWGILDAYYAVGGRWAKEFPQPAPEQSEPDDSPARASALVSSRNGAIDIAGDIDWYRYEVSAYGSARIRLAASTYDVDRAQNFDPVLYFFDPELRLLGFSDGADATAVEVIQGNVAPGTHYVAVANYNGGADTRPYYLSASFSPGSAIEPTPGEHQFLRTWTPSDFATGVRVTTTPKVTFTRPLDPTSVTSSTVRLVNGRNGKSVSVSRSYDPVTNAVTLRPSSALRDNTPYRVVVGAVRDTDGATHGQFSYTFRTVNTAPPKVTSLKAKGGYKKATLTWTKPSITDLDKIIVRRSAGKTPPASPTSGKGVYKGTGSSKTVTGLRPGKNYSFAVWVKDRTGKLSPARTVTLRGTALKVSAKSSITKGNSVTVRAQLVNKSSGNAVSGATVKLYARKKGTSTWRLLTTRTTSSTGRASFTHKPGATWEYRWSYSGSKKRTGSRTTVTVKVT